MPAKEFIAKNGLIIKGATAKLPNGFAPASDDDIASKKYVDDNTTNKVPLTRTINGKALSSDIALSKSDIGLSNVDNTSDLDKPISNAVQTALNGKEPLIPTGTSAQYIRGDKQLATLNSTAVGLGNVNNVAQLPLSYLDTDSTLSANSDTKVPSQKAVKTYIDTKPVTAVGSTLNLFSNFI